MDKLNFDHVKTKVEPKRTVLRWQDKAIEALKYFTDGDQFRGSIFKKYKDNDRAADIALIDCKELNKPFARYFLKVWSEINKNLK